MSSSTQPEFKVLIVAGEASSALYAQRLLEYWQKNNIPIKAYGVGSLEMEELGFQRLGRSEDMAVVGLQEVLSEYGNIRKVFYSLIDSVSKVKPQAALLLDYPDFNLRLAKKLKKLGLPIFYYISPQVWAWRSSRVFLIQKFIDKMLVVFPFEVDFYKKHNVSVEFVGHPLLDEIGEEVLSQERQKNNREKFGIADSDRLLGLMPGSRRSELRFNLKTQIQAAQKIYRSQKNVKVALFIAPGLSRETIDSFMCEYDFPLIFIQDDPLNMISMADVIITASGTATLMVGLMKKPMVIMYKMKPLTAWLAKKIVKGTSFFGMINLVLGKEIVKEYFQEKADPDTLKVEVEKILEDSSYRNQMIENLGKATEILGKKGATERVSQVLELALKGAKE